MSKNEYVTPDLEVRVYSVSFAYTMKVRLDDQGDFTTITYPRIQLPALGSEHDQALIDRFFGFVQRMAKEGGLGIVIESDDSCAEVIRFYKHGENTTRDILLSRPPGHPIAYPIPKWLVYILNGIRPGKPGEVGWLPVLKEEAIRGRTLKPGKSGKNYDEIRAAYIQGWIDSVNEPRPFKVARESMAARYVDKLATADAAAVGDAA